MNLSPILPKTPIRTPQTGTSTKTLQLTPIWEAVVKSHRIPSEVNENLVFQEISSRLEDLEWPVRQHAFRVLYDIIPIVSKDRLDERIIQNDILNKLIVNLGHPAPGVRKVAMETIRQYLKQTLYSEKMLESFVLYGVKEDFESDVEEIGIVRENVILGTIVSLVEILKPFVFPENGGYSVSQPFLNRIVAIISEKMKSPLYQEKCAETLWKIRDMIGENRFIRALEHLPDQTLINLIHLRDVHEKLMLNETKSHPKRISDENQDSDQSFEMKLENTVTTYHNCKITGRDGNGNITDWLMGEKLNTYENLEESTEDYSDGTDTDTYTKETPNHQIEVEQGFIAESKVEAEQETLKVAEISDEINPKDDLKVLKEAATDITPSSPRVVLETEIQFSEDKAIKMTIVEDEKDSAVKDNEIDIFPAEVKTIRESSAERRYVTEDGDLIMKILHNSENNDFEEEERKRTPRRVRFGGEVIKLRTPDSDEMDVAGDVQRGETPKHEISSRPTTAHGKVDGRSRPEIKLSPAKKDPHKVDKLIIQDSKMQSHIPLPISPATKSPRSREVSPSKKSSRARSPATMKTKVNEEETDPLSPDSTTEEEVEDDVDNWKWEEFGLVGEKIIADLKNQNDWKIQYQALEELKVTLIKPRVIDKIGNVAEDAKLSSLFKCLLQKLPQSNNQQVTNLSISIVFQLIQTLSKEAIKRNLQDIVKGLCRYVGGCKNVNLKIESVQSLKMLFSILEPSSVIDTLLNDCLMSSSSKMRENALLAIMYATMTFPSDSFNAEDILQKVVNSASDSRRRVRHAALEAISILSQFCSSETLNETVSRVADTLPCNATKNELISAVHARLSRRVLPTVSNEGLVLYALQIPASRRFGGVGNPSGADVSWILSGTGSVSTGSARTRGQLNAAQRLDLPVSAPLSPSKWRSNSQPLPAQYTFSNPEKTLPDKMKSENPWTKQKNRTESSGSRQSTQENWKNHGNRMFKAPSTGNLAGRQRETLRFNSNDNLIDEQARIPRIYPVDVMNVEGLRPEELSWALVPVSSLEEQQLSRIRNNQLWGEFGFENGSQCITSPLGTLRPLYLKLQPSPEGHVLSKSSDDLRRSSFPYGGHRGSERYKDDDFTQIRVLTPSILREKNRIEDSEVNSSTARIARSELQESDTVSRIPPLQSMSTSRNIQKPSKSNDPSGNDKMSHTRRNRLLRTRKNQIPLLQSSRNYQHEVPQKRSKRKGSSAGNYEIKRKILRNFDERTCYNRSKMVENDDNNNFSDEEKMSFKKRKFLENGRDYLETNALMTIQNDGKRFPWYEYLFCCKFARKISPTDRDTVKGMKDGKTILADVASWKYEKKFSEESYAKQNGGPVQNGGPESVQNSVVFPNIHSNGNVNHEYNYLQQKSSRKQFSDGDNGKIQETVTQLDGLLTNGKGYGKQSLPNRNGDVQSLAPLENETILPIRSGTNKKIGDFGISNGLVNDHGNLFDPKGNHSPQNQVASAPALINGNGREQTPSTSSSNSTEFGIVSGNGIRLQRLKNGSGALDRSSRGLNGGYNQKVKVNRVGISKNNKVTHSGSPFPETVKPFDRPKEGLETCFSQLESQQWEVVMLGLSSLVRLLRHHPAILLSQLHPMIMALGRQIRNLRSQVSRAACQAASEMFISLKRNVEVDLEELAGPLFHRSADTNRFIRQDCGQALDNMTDNVSPTKAINVIISKGTAHQNAIVRTVAARLLLRLSEKIGAEKILSLPRETRDKVVQSGANLLMEGKLETRAYAKELFKVWSSHPSFSNLMLEAIPPNVMRHISKTLISLKT